MKKSNFGGGGSKKRHQTHTDPYGFLLRCKRQFSCNVLGFNLLEICNIDVYLIQLSKYIYLANITTVCRTATGKESQK